MGAKAEAVGRAEAAKIEAETSVQGARLKAEALRIETESELERMKSAREAEIRFTIEQNKLEIEKAVGTETIKAMAGGPQEQQVRMLQSLGLKSTLITDGRTPINLLNTANGLMGGVMTDTADRSEQH